MKQLMDVIQQQGAAIQRLMQQQSGHQSTNSGLAGAATLALSLDTRIGKFAYDPDSGFTFEHWYKRYGKFIEDDGKDLEDATKVRLLVGKLNDPEYARFADSILPNVPDALSFKDVVKRLKSLFGDSRSLFVRRFECFKLKQSAGQEVAEFISKVNAACENADLDLSKETLKCLIMVAGLQDEHHDLRQRCLQLLEESRKKNEEMTLEKLGEECLTYMLIRDSAKSLAQPSKVQMDANAVRAHPQQWKERHGTGKKAHKPEPKD